MLAQSHKEGGAAEEEEKEEEEPDVVLVKVERLEEAEPTSGLSIQEGEWNAAGHLTCLTRQLVSSKGRMQILSV